MTKIIINGGNKLQGTLPIFGAKNACLPIICASVLANDKVELTNIPDLSDISLLLELLEEIGFAYKLDKANRIITITPQEIKNTELDEKANRMRASIWFLAPLLAKKGKIKLPYPGGCSIGGRPIDITLDGLRAMGVEFEESSNYLIASCDQLIGAKFRLHFQSVGATEGLLMAAATAKGQTILENVAKEPEVIDTMDFLNAMGADIKFTSSREITINGVEKLAGCQHNIVPDRITTGTYAILAALTAGEKGIKIENCNPNHIESELNVLKQAGVKMDIYNNSIFIPQQNHDYQQTDFETHPFPGFATDLQSPMTVFLTQANGVSHVTENIYENRLMHLPELKKMGAKMEAVSNHIATIRGVTELNCATVKSTDLRASAALVIAGLLAKGQTVVEEVEHLDRGYETLDKFLSAIGADIRREED